MAAPYVEGPLEGWLIAIIVLSVLCIVVAIICCCERWFNRRRRQKKLYDVRTAPIVGTESVTATFQPPALEHERSPASALAAASAEQLAAMQRQVAERERAAAEESRRAIELDAAIREEVRAREAEQRAQRAEAALRIREAAERAQRAEAVLRIREAEMRAEAAEQALQSPLMMQQQQTQQQLQQPPMAAPEEVAPPSMCEEWLAHHRLEPPSPFTGRKRVQHFKREPNARVPPMRSGMWLKLAPSSAAHLLPTQVALRPIAQNGVLQGAAGGHLHLR